MNKEYRMKDTRDEEGTGSLMVERRVAENVWVSVSTRFFYQGQLKSISIYEDSVDDVSLVQITDKKSVWTKTTKRNYEENGRWFNLTCLSRKDAPEKKGDC